MDTPNHFSHYLPNIFKQLYHEPLKTVMALASDLKLLVIMLYQICLGRYTQKPIRSIVGVICFILYVVFPSHLDKLILLILLIDFCKEDLRHYSLWDKTKENTDHIP